MIELEYENDFKQKILHQRFTSLAEIETKEDVQQWRNSWTEALKSWHSPYKCLIDCSQLKISNDEVKKPLDLMFKFFKAFFLRKTVGYGLKPTFNHHLLPFEVVEDLATAEGKIGIRKGSSQINKDDFRSLIRLENHFKEQIMELSFDANVEINEKKQIQVIKSKLTNQLMMWHSPWNLLLDCSNFKISSQLNQDFLKSLQFFKGFFLTNIIGYQPADTTANYPFKVFRSRHKAVLELEKTGSFVGDIANCSTRK